LDLADDLTGAADAVAPFARHGMRADLAYVVRGKLRGDLEESDARAWDTETRVLPPERSVAITRLTRAATRRLKAFDPLLYYKKIDSTLRGHLRWNWRRCGVNFPAAWPSSALPFPQNGRTVENGRPDRFGAPLSAPGRQTVGGV